MSKNVPKKAIDITGVELTPGEPTVCLGNGKQGFACCCDECNYYLLCFPEFDLKEEIKDIKVSKRYKIQLNRLFRERIGGSLLPFPEVDCFYERVRSKIIVKLKIHEFLDKRKKRRRMK